MLEVVFPGHLLVPEAKDDLIMFLAALDIPPRRKKQLLVEWGQLTGIILTREDFERLLGEELPWARG